MNAARMVVYIPAGLLADRIGRKPVMVTGWLLGPLAMLLLLRAESWPDVIPALVVFAAVEWCAPAYHSYITVAAGPRELPYAFTTMVIGATLGAAISAPAGGWLAETFGLRWLFAGSLVAFAASSVLIVFLRSDPRERSVYAPPPAPPADPSPAITPSPATGPDAATPLAATPMVWTWPPRARRGWRLPQRFRWRWSELADVWSAEVVATLAIVIAVEFAANLAQPLAPNWLAEQHGHSPANIGVFGGASASAAVAFALAIGRLRRRLGPRPALALVLIALIIYAVTLLAASTWLVAVAAYALRGAFSLLPSLAATLMGQALTARFPVAGGATAVTEVRSMGLGFALNKTASAIALTLSTFTAGWLYGVAPPLPFVLSIILLLPLPWLISPIRGAPRLVGAGGVLSRMIARRS